MYPICPLGIQWTHDKKGVVISLENENEEVQFIIPNEQLIELIEVLSLYQLSNSSIEPIKAFLDEPIH